MKTGKRRPAGSLRIIGGSWRGRRLPIPDIAGLRPTPDRVRETLFNWLAPMLPGACCLDAFAGTGALGLEALSRGAAHCLFVEQNGRLVRELEQSFQVLNTADRAQALAGAWPRSRAEVPDSFDLIFLDPPFDRPLLLPALESLSDRLKPGHRVYLEYAAHDKPRLPMGWVWLKSGQAGQAGFGLVHHDGATAATVSSHRSDGEHEPS